MKTKALMTCSSFLLGGSGIILIFIPDVVLTHLGLDVNQISNLMVQIIGGLYFGFSMLNWMIKGGQIGGIYNRPVVIANLSHFMIAGLELSKALIANPGLPVVLWIAAFVTSVFGLLFAILIVIHPENQDV